jgi:hypothetical protein
MMTFLKLHKVRWMFLYPRLTWTILTARVRSTRTRMQVLFEVMDAIHEVPA